MQRAYYRNSITEFLKDNTNSILGELSYNHSNHTLNELQRNAWISQIQILKKELFGINGHIYFEFAIPRMGKRVDNIIIFQDKIFIVEFKIGDRNHSKSAQEQVIDYCLDLKNFHEGSHSKDLIPILISSKAKAERYSKSNVLDLKEVVKLGSSDLSNLINDFDQIQSESLNIKEWENSKYKPTPTIVEAAQALYKGHSVNEISRSDAGAINLTKTSNCINRIIQTSKQSGKKSICFITGVPGAGKTLAGLNVANERMKVDENEHAVFLSGNGPLVDVLREALARNLVSTEKKNGIKITKKEAQRRTNAFIQNIHHFRDEYLKDSYAPTEKVVVFDEAQRAWTNHQVSSFMKRKKGIEDFNMSEPEFLIDVMDRHSDWCTVICLIGGGQEINTGEAGLEEWVNALQRKFDGWDIYYSNLITESENYLKNNSIKNWMKNNAVSASELHLGVSIRSFRSEELSAFIYNLLELNLDTARSFYARIKNKFPIYITRDLALAKAWLKQNAKGSERIGVIGSSGAKRLRPMGVDVKNEISAPNWFLNGKSDIRSSYFLEDVATEFEIQGLEIDWACVAWGGNFYFDGDQWKYQKFKGSKWMNINNKIDREYLKNTYRVLLTRARQGMIIFIPNGDDFDETRKGEFYDETYDYLKFLGIHEILV